ncbi:MAG TPA: peroxiredoxin [Polyangiaceae bacterium]|nr:peroxiredoxin [Polyangiaceae bacterium]
MAKTIEVGDTAPDFELSDQSGQRQTLRGLCEQGPLVLYFYPKDDTPVCTQEACYFRDDRSAFQEAGAQVVGVSDDSVQSHDKFAQRHGLEFKLLADVGGRVREAYGVGKTLGLLKGRVTFVIDRERVVRHVFRSQLAARRHVDEALESVRAIAARRA